MLKFYLITIAIFYLAFVLILIRYYANKENIKLGAQREKKWFIWIRFFAIGFIPVINLLMAMCWIYFSVLASSERFKDVMNK